MDSEPEHCCICFRDIKSYVRTNYRCPNCHKSYCRTCLQACFIDKLSKSHDVLPICIDCNYTISPEYIPILLSDETILHKYINHVVDEYSYNIRNLLMPRIQNCLTLRKVLFAKTAVPDRISKLFNICQEIINERYARLENPGASQTQNNQNKEVNNSVSTAFINLFLTLIADKDFIFSSDKYDGFNMIINKFRTFSKFLTTEDLHNLTFALNDLLTSSVKKLVNYDISEYAHLFRLTPKELTRRAYNSNEMFVDNVKMIPICHCDSPLCNGIVYQMIDKSGCSDVVLYNRCSVCMRKTCHHCWRAINVQVVEDSHEHNSNNDSNDNHTHNANTEHKQRRHVIVDANFVLTNISDQIKPHVCKEADIETVKTILSTTSPCPRCGFRIEKAAGCNDMFCTNCKSGFNYTNSAPITREFHNPHRQEWLNANRNAWQRDEEHESVSTNEGINCFEHEQYRAHANDKNTKYILAYTNSLMQFLQSTVFHRRIYEFDGDAMPRFFSVVSEYIRKFDTQISQFELENESTIAALLKKESKGFKSQFDHYNNLATRLIKSGEDHIVDQGRRYTLDDIRKEFERTLERYESHIRSVVSNNLYTIHAKLKKYIAAKLLRSSAADMISTSDLLLKNMMQGAELIESSMCLAKCSSKVMSAVRDIYKYNLDGYIRDVIDRAYAICGSEGGIVEGDDVNDDVKDNVSSNASTKKSNSKSSKRLNKKPQQSPRRTLKDVISELIESDGMMFATALKISRTTKEITPSGKSLRLCGSEVSINASNVDAVCRDLSDISPNIAFDDFYAYSTEDIRDKNPDAEVIVNAGYLDTLKSLKNIVSMLKENTKLIRTFVQTDFSALYEDAVKISNNFNRTANNIVKLFGVNGVEMTLIPNTVVLPKPLTRHKMGTIMTTHSETYRFLQPARKYKESKQARFVLNSVKNNFGRDLVVRV